MQKVIDVSKHNGTINWTKVRGQVDGAIIRIGYRGYGTGTIAIDPQAKTNIKGCQDNSIPFGVYFFPCSITDGEAAQEAEWILNQVKGLQMAFPIYLDSEVAEAVRGSGRADKLSVADRTRYLKVIIDKLQSAGYTAGVYASYDWLYNRLNVSGLPTGTKIWVAQWSSKCTYTGTYAAWQYTSKATVTGINGAVDMSYYYEETGTTASNSDKSIGQLAIEVIDGKWGTAPNRKPALTKAGYNYDEVQSRVNQIIKVQTDLSNRGKNVTLYQKNIEEYTKLLDQETKLVAGLETQLAELKK